VRRSIHWWRNRVRRVRMMTVCMNEGRDRDRIMEYTIMNTVVDYTVSRCRYIGY
jgi:hypothetical protein